LRWDRCLTPVYLNKLREREYIHLFGEKLSILQVQNIGVGEGKEFLTPAIREELAEYSEEELLKRNIVIVARKEQ
jgi:hypothetical protein